MALICDTGGIYALYDADDAHHAAVRAAVEAEVGPLYLPAILFLLSGSSRCRVGCAHQDATGCGGHSPPYGKSDSRTTRRNRNDGVVQRPVTHPDERGGVSKQNLSRRRSTASVR